MRRRTIATLLIIGFAACGLGAAAKSESHGDGGLLRSFIHERLGELKKLHDDLDVSKDQRDKIRDVLGEHRKEIVDVAKPLVEKRRALHEAVMAKNPDENAIRSAASDLGKAIGDAAVLASKVKPEVEKVLTSEQREKIKEFQKDNEKAVDEFLDKIASH